VALGLGAQRLRRRLLFKIHDSADVCRVGLQLSDRERPYDFGYGFVDWGGDLDGFSLFDDPAVEGVNFYSAASDDVLEEAGATGSEGLGSGDEFCVELGGIGSVGDVDELL